MSEDTANLLSAIKQLTAVVQLNLNRLVLALVNNTKWLASVAGIGKKISASSMGKQLGVKTMAQFLEKVSAIQPPTDAIVQAFNFGPQPSGGTAAPPAKGIKKLFLGMKSGMKGMGAAAKGILSSVPQLALMAIVLEPLTALLGAFLEPLEMLTPLFESWGSMLGQLIIPIALALMEVLMPFTPMIQALVSMLVPLIPLLILIFKIMNPIIFVLPFIIDAITMVANVLTIVTVAIGGVVEIANTFIDNVIKGIADWLGGLWDLVSTWAGNIVAAIVNWVRDAVQSVKEAVSNFFKGGFDGDPDTWY